jgi:hypothetical protein
MSGHHLKAMLLALVAAFAPLCARAEQKEMVLLGNDFRSWSEPRGSWYSAADATLDPKDEKKLLKKDGKGAAINGPDGRTAHLVSKDEFGDCQLHIEFMVAKGANSGVYLQGRYEIQVYDSFGVKEPHHSDCGGIYQRWHEQPGLEDSQRGYEGRPPLANPSKPAGEWQIFDITFRAPRFDANGKKSENAKFVTVKLNGTVVQENAEVTGPTRAAMFDKEKPTGPLMLQGDHGPVAYRNVRVSPLDSDKK